jgi:hypothetical protein
VVGSAGSEQSGSRDRDATHSRKGLSGFMKWGQLRRGSDYSPTGARPHLYRVQPRLDHAIRLKREISS